MVLGFFAWSSLLWEDIGDLLGERLGDAECFLGPLGEVLGPLGEVLGPLGEVLGGVINENPPQSTGLSHSSEDSLDVAVLVGKGEEHLRILSALVGGDRISCSTRGDCALGTRSGKIR